MKMKPETIARRAAERAAETVARQAETLRRLDAKAAEGGPLASMWAELAYNARMRHQAEPLSTLALRSESLA